MKSAGRESEAAFRSVVRNYPQKELQLHRLYRANEEFRSLCDDHFAAVKAKEFWGAAGDARKEGEYKLLAEELQALILKALD